MHTPRQTDWLTLMLLAAMLGLWLGNMAVHAVAPLPLWVHVLVATAAIHLSFTVWHEAAHRNISAHRWVNDVVGMLAIFPYLAPYFFERWMHLQHHALLNQPEDPNGIYTDGSFWTLPFRYPRAVGYALRQRGQDPRTPWERRLDLVNPLLVVVILGFAAWQGALLDLVWLWGIPFVLSKLIMDWYVNYLPHAGLPASRHGGTRVVDVDWLTPLILGHNYHAIHHLWPNLPWHVYRRTFREKREALVERGVPVERSLAGLWSFGVKPR